MKISSTWKKIVFYFFPLKTCISFHNSTDAAAWQASLSCLPDISQIWELLPKLKTQKKPSRSRKAFYTFTAWSLCGVKLTQNTSARDRIPQHHGVHVGKWRNVCLRSDCEETIKRKGNSEIESAHSVIKTAWSRNVRGFVFFSLPLFFLSVFEYMLVNVGYLF